ncbi:MAG: TetR/AcrR family transcriptional regulator [Candidatus Ornithomonoglobus sp.]
MDRRNEKTEKAFTDALFHFLKKKELNKITVTELCDYADMNRGTFYLHYLDIYDLMDKAEQKIVDSIFDGKPDEPQSFQRDILDTFEYIKANKEVYKILLTAHKINGFIDKLSQKIIARSKSQLVSTVGNLDDKLAENVSLFYIGGAAALLYGWVVENDCSTPAEVLLKTAGDVAYLLHDEKNS